MIFVRALCRKKKRYYLLFPGGNKLREVNFSESRCNLSVTALNSISTCYTQLNLLLGESKYFSMEKNLLYGDPLLLSNYCSHINQRFVFICYLVKCKNTYFFNRSLTLWIVEPFILFLGLQHSSSCCWGVRVHQGWATGKPVPEDCLGLWWQVQETRIWCLWCI